MIERFCVKKGKYFIAINPFLETFISQSSFGQIFNVPNPVSKLFYQCSDKTQKSQILFVAILSPIKGIIELLQVAKIVRDRHPEMELRIVGHFSAGLEWYEKEVRKFLNQNNLQENVNFLGFMDEVGIARELSHANCLIVTSKIETASMVIAEAMAAGKPAVAMDVGGIRYTMQDGVSGFLVSSGDIEGMADRIVRILEDVSLRKEMGIAAKQLAFERFYPEVIANKTLAVYEEILQMEHRR